MRERDDGANYAAERTWKTSLFGKSAVNSELISRFGRAKDPAGVVQGFKQGRLADQQ